MSLLGVEVSERYGVVEVGQGVPIIMMAVRTLICISTKTVDSINIRNYLCHWAVHR